MRKVIHKWFWAWNFDKEEKWLNELASKGLALLSVGFCRYEFEDSLPGEYSIRLELLEQFPSHPESEKYISFLEDTGVEHISSIYRWVYFRKKATDGSFDLFSDNSSRIKHLKRILFLLSTLLIFDTFTTFFNLHIFFINGSIINGFCGLWCLLLDLLLIFGFFKVNNKIRKLKKDNQIFE